MSRCIQIAKNGLGTTAPNPMVGCVIVYDTNIIGEGFTSPYGGPHAEVNAIQSVLEPSLLTQSTLYVSLEPCSHYGKTPPCVDLIIHKKIPKVVIGIRDPHAKVDGKGIQNLRDSGTEVITDVLERQCYELNKRFFTFHTKKRPYIILKWAESLDGFIAPKKKDETAPFWISNKNSRQLTHKWRAEEESILVGAKTVSDDDPSLTTRDYFGKNPIRIIFKNDKPIPKIFKIFDDTSETIIVESSKIDSPQGTIQELLSQLFNKGITSVIVEGGRKTLNLFLDSGIWDEARIFVGSSLLNEGISAPELIKPPYLGERILNDQFYVLINHD